MPIAPASRPSTDDEDRRRALPPKRLRRSRKRAGHRRRSRQEGGVAEDDAAALDRADRALARRRVEIGDRQRGGCRFSSAARTIASASGCSLARSTLAASRRTSSSVKAVGRDDRRHRRPALGQRAGLVDDERVDLLHALERLGVPDQHAGLRAAADADHDRHRRGEAERARTGDDEHRRRPRRARRRSAARAQDAPRRRRRGPPPRSRPARTSADTWSARRWIGARLRCASATSCTICASSVSRPTFSARITRLPVWFIVPPITRSPGSFATGIDSPVTIDSSTAPLPSIDDAVDRHALARAARAAGRRPRPGRARPPPRRRPARHAARGLRREIEQRADGAAGRLARPELQHLAEQHEHGDDRGRLEIDGDAAVHAAERRRERSRARASRRRCRARRRRCPWRSA